MKTPIIFLVLVLACFGASCSKSKKRVGTSPELDVDHHAPTAADPDGATKRIEFDKRLKAAKELFEKRDIPSALAALDSASELVELDPEVLNLRGSCHVYMRDFDQALKDFTEADKRKPGNAQIRFNIGEVNFVTKHWKEAIEAFQQARQLFPADSHGLHDLIDFKVMLCHAALGDTREFNRLAAQNLAIEGTLKFYYTKASVEFLHNHNDDRAGEILAEACRAYPIPNALAPWQDTLLEFGWKRPAHHQEAEQPGPAQPATQPVDKPSVKNQPSTPTSEDAPR